LSGFTSTRDPALHAKLKTQNSKPKTNLLVSIATKTGDAGETALMYGKRVPKTHRRVEACGTVDELNSSLGLVRATTDEMLIQEVVLSVQKELVIVMGELALRDDDRERYLKDGYKIVTAAMVDRLTDVVNDLEKNYHIVFKHWATPGHNLSSAALDVARTTCRRAERRVVALADSTDYVNPEAIRYLNRLSDVLWLFARFIETEAESVAKSQLNHPRSRRRSLKAAAGNALLATATEPHALPEDLAKVETNPIQKMSRTKTSSRTK
jgi:cob(I)alamin adenosyltransferase